VTLCALGLGTAFWALGEIKISVTITGDADEILPIIMQIKETVGQAGEKETEISPVEVHSITVGSQGEQGEKTILTSSDNLDVKPVLSNATLSPETAKAGEEVQIRVSVSDPAHIVDTISAEIGLPEPITIDLFDKGDEGDAIAGDGIWTRTFTVPGSVQVGTYPVKVHAFDADGEPIRVSAADGTEVPLSVTTVMTVAP